MEKEKRWDMFDVACGDCELVQFLLTRFNPLDLKTKINLAPSAIVDEQFAPKKEDEDEDEVQKAPEPPPPPPEPQRPQVMLNDIRDRRVSEPVAIPTGQDTFRPKAPAAPDVELESVDLQGDGAEEDIDYVLEPVGPPPPRPSPSPPPMPAPKGPDWLSLIQGFHEAAQRYQAEIAPTEKSDDEEA